MCPDKLSIADNTDLQCPVSGGGQATWPEEATAGVSSFRHIAAFCERSPKATSVHRAGGIVYMCLRRDMLLLDPSFVFTVTLGRGSVTRLLSRPLDLSLSGPQTAPCLLRGQAPSSASGASTA